ncbi:hypothetical protein EDD22DRAFT_970796 [Suillus occidentalis]|nr:hypothetical protein EDD22DRAFT_970796 [Suillus occidentalis]
MHHDSPSLSTAPLRSVRLQLHPAACLHSTIRAKGKIGPPHAPDECRLPKLLGDVLPELELIFNATMIKFDALVWLDQQGREQELVALDNAVRTRPALFGYHNHRLPYLPFGSSRATRGHARSRGSATRGPR